MNFIVGEIRIRQEMSYLMDATNNFPNWFIDNENNINIIVVTNRASFHYKEHKDIISESLKSMLVKEGMVLGIEKPKQIEQEIERINNSIYNVGDA